MKNFFKKLTVLICVAAVAVVSLSPAGAVMIKRYYGDVDNDGYVTSADAREVMLAALSLSSLEGDDKTCGDIDGNGSLSIADALAILRMAVGLIPQKYMDEYEFDPCADKFTKLINAYRNEKVPDYVNYTCSDLLCEAATEAAREFAEDTGNALTRLDGTYYNKLLNEFGITYKVCDKAICVSGTNYKRAFEAFKDSPQSEKAFLSSNYKKIGIGGYTVDGRTFYWCIFFVG